MKDYEIRLTKQAEKDIKKVPESIRRKLFEWVETVKCLGLPETRRVPGIHDEPLKGERKGQRSIRLSRSYRAIYRVEQETIWFEMIVIEEVNKHAY